MRGAGNFKTVMDVLTPNCHACLDTTQLHARPGVPGFQRAVALPNCTRALLIADETFNTS